MSNMITNAIETPFVWKFVTYDITNNNGKVTKESFDGKFAGDVLISRTRSNIVYEGTFNEKYCLHGEKCTIYTNELHHRIFEYKGEFDNGRLKKGLLRSGSNGYYKYSTMYNYTLCDEPNDCYITCKGEFDLNSGYLLKGILIDEHEFKLYYNHTTYKEQRCGYIVYKEGTFDPLIPYALTEGKQILYNGVIMQGIFNGEQLKDGKVIYTYVNGGTKILEGNFTNGEFDWDGKFYKNSHNSNSNGKLIKPKCNCSVM